jgi:conjugal transfer pilus assembly protein TraW
MKFILSLALLSVATVALSQDLGVIGEVFPVKEVSFLMLIESRMKAMDESGELNRMQAIWQEEVDAYVRRPTSVGLKRAITHRIHRYKPAIVLQQDIRNEKGEILFHQGTKLNALDALKNYEPHWLFFDADDKAQVAWVIHTLKKVGDARIILVGGDVSRMEALLNQPIYFDQGGKISHQLGIKAVPSMVTRENLSLLIQEIAISEDGHAL